MMRVEAANEYRPAIPFPIPANVVEMVKEQVATRPEATATQYKAGGQWRSHTWKELWEEIRAVGAALLAEGVEVGDRVAILSATRVEHAIADLGILAARGSTVPLYQSHTPDEVRFTLEDSGSVVVFAENEDQLAKLRQVRARLPKVRRVVLFDGAPGAEDGDWVVAFAEFTRRGREALDRDASALEERIAGIEAEDTACILYTSGTTGVPKGVVLTHRNWCYEAASVARVGLFEEGESILLFLSLAHSFAKVCVAAWLHLGAVMAFAESPEKVVDNCAEIRPNILPAAPRVFEKVYTAVVGNGTSAPGLKGVLFRWAMGLFEQYVKARKEGRPFGGLQWTLAKKLVFAKVARVLKEERLGGRLRLFVSGSAPLAPAIAYFFELLGLTILEGYGLTETSAATCVNPPTRNKIGTVGPPVPGTELRIADDGEVLVRGGGVMKGYYNRPDETAAVLSPDGWLATGDIGEIDEDGYLRITDRKKDIIVTAGGKNVAPQKIESLLKTNPLISQVVVYGDKRKYLTALITVEAANGRKFLEQRGIQVSSYEEMTRHPAIREAIQRTVDKVNADLPRFETIKKFAIPPSDFSLEQGEITPTLKVKRKLAAEKYKDLLDAMYDEKFD
ncbi:MAG TPA: long-chain fatty acid--CoA ligase [Fredinandcohnia sp.]|nr:long-chain fatty acid--CoA ligase [Fredinandcohnia sp.]